MLPLKHAIETVVFIYLAIFLFSSNMYQNYTLISIDINTVTEFASWCACILCAFCT